MKKTIFTILLCVITSIAFAQYDNKFYFPSKKYRDIDSLINYEKLTYFIDQDTLTGVLIKPKGLIKASVIYFHGTGGNITTYIDYVSPLVNDNFQVVMIDFRGYGKSTGTPTHINIASDAQIIFDSLLARSDVKDNQIVIYGASMGSQVATNLTRNNQDQVSALILDGALSSFTDIAVESAPKILKGIIRKQVTSPYSAFSDIEQINGIKIILIHSKEDSSIPFEQGKKVFENANEPKFLWVYEGDHLEAPIKHPEKFLNYFNKAITNN
jgi:uncharacterized protein